MDTTETDLGRIAITGEPDPMPFQGAIEFVVHPPLMNVRIMRTDKGKICGVAQIQTQRGPITFAAAADEKMIREAVARVLLHRMRRGELPMTNVGAVQNWADNASSEVAKANVLRHLIEQAKTLATSPQIARAMGLSTVVIPAPGSAAHALFHATELLQGLKRRDPKSVAAWRKLIAASRLGNQKARRIVHVVHLVARAPRIVARH
jgi:hypothetical protein